MSNQGKTGNEERTVELDEEAGKESLKPELEPANSAVNGMTTYQKMKNLQKKIKDDMAVDSEEANPYGITADTPNSVIFSKAFSHNITEEDKSRGKRIAYARKQAGLTQEELAKKIGMTQSTVTTYETGRADPKCGGITNIARACKCSTDYLLGLKPYSDDEDGEETSGSGLTDRAKKIARDFDYLRQPEQDLCEAIINYISEFSLSRPEETDLGKLYFVKEEHQGGEIKLTMNSVENYFKNIKEDKS